MGKTSNHYILILCGGTGPRLWPLSRANHPKQFLALLNSKTLVENTYQRLLKLVPKNNVFFISNYKYLNQLKQIFGHSVPNQNFISEPSKKNTSMAILLGTAIIQKINPNAIITTTPADHFIDKLEYFRRDLCLAHNLATSSDNIVTIGIKPTSPNPAYGYILPSLKIKNYFPVSQFIEKPSTIDANLYIKRHALWNSGIYTFSIKTILTQFLKLQPQYHSLFEKLVKSPNKISSVYKISPNLAIDKAISEKSDSLIMISARFIWSDIGQWQSIYSQLSPKKSIVSINPRTNFVHVNSSQCLVSGPPKKLIGLVGLNNLAIIDTPDALLVCNLSDSYSVRDLITKIVSDVKLKKYFLKKNDQQSVS